jgi:hypothetical protein
MTVRRCCAATTIYGSPCNNHPLPVLRRPAARRDGRPERSQLPPARPRLGPDQYGRIPAPGRTQRTDDGARREERSLKHRADGETGSIPIPARPGLKSQRADRPLWDRLQRAHIPPTPVRRGLAGCPPPWCSLRPAGIPASPPPLQSAARRRISVAERRRGRYRGRAPRAAASPSCSRSTPTASPASPAPPTGASATRSTNPAATDLTMQAGAVGRPGVPLEGEPSTGVARAGPSRLIRLTFADPGGIGKGATPEGRPGGSRSDPDVMMVGWIATHCG